MIFPLDNRHFITELVVPSSEYGFMVEGDQGTLTFQGTRYLSFDRNY